eukprot:TRINITY_DN23686_c0_g1_i1.p1 TRINITY_DN23686_c0_g1~~TRINITY_DN23686_c0_g1_i1.p1  ORF type:complete len:258 (-),score=43.16 TRINITY_DN23686_c0_g1_i1:225-998(-)
MGSPAFGQSVDAASDHGRFAPSVEAVGAEGNGDCGEEFYHPMDAASRIGAIISQATDQLDEAAINDESSRPEHAACPSRSGGDVGSHGAPTGGCDEMRLETRQPAPTPSSRSGKNARLMGTGATRNVAMGADIAQILSASRQHSDVRQYIAKKDFGRVPAFLNSLTEELDDEQLYINALREPREAPSMIVRLLRQDEKDYLVRGLEQQFEYVMERFSEAPDRSRAKAKLEVQLEKIKQDIASLNRPYIFVEDDQRSE